MQVLTFCKLLAVRVRRDALVFAAVWQYELR